MIIASTDPLANTRLGNDFPFAKVANMALDMFCDTSQVAAIIVRRASEKGAQPKQSLLEVVEGLPNGKQWEIQKHVEKGFEIRTLITDTYSVSEIYKFSRLGMDVVVSAVRLALYWAIQEGNQTAVSALKSPIVDWPMDFILISGSTPEEIEESAFKWFVNMSARSERLREHLCFETQNLMRIV